MRETTCQKKFSKYEKTHWIPIKALETRPMESPDIGSVCYSSWTSFRSFKWFEGYCRQQCEQSIRSKDDSLTINDKIKNPNVLGYHLEKIQKQKNNISSLDSKRLMVQLIWFRFMKQWRCIFLQRWTLATDLELQLTRRDSKCNTTGKVDLDSYEVVNSNLKIFEEYPSFWPLELQNVI